MADALVARLAKPAAGVQLTDVGECVDSVPRHPLQVHQDAEDLAYEVADKRMGTERGKLMLFLFFASFLIQLQMRPPLCEQTSADDNRNMTSNIVCTAHTTCCVRVILLPCTMKTGWSWILLNLALHPSFPHLPCGRLTLDLQEGHRRVRLRKPSFRSILSTALAFFSTVTRFSPEMTSARSLARGAPPAFIGRNRV